MRYANGIIAWGICEEINGVKAKRCCYEQQAKQRKDFLSFCALCSRARYHTLATNFTATGIETSLDKIACVSVCMGG